MPPSQDNSQNARLNPQLSNRKMPLLRTCPVCARQFDAHPNAIYCDITCSNKAAYRRRSARRLRKATAPTSPYQFIFDNIDGETLSRIYADVQTHIYNEPSASTAPYPPTSQSPPTSTS